MSDSPAEVVAEPLVVRANQLQSAVTQHAGCAAFVAACWCFTALGVKARENAGKERMPGKRGRLVSFDCSKACDLKQTVAMTAPAS